jgi:hypothetical protein
MLKEFILYNYYERMPAGIMQGNMDARRGIVAITDWENTCCSFGMREDILLII